jgi:probable phosphoglycerate mutase
VSSVQRVYLVRHGEAAASWGQSADPGLSELGQRQAREVATRLEQELAEVAPLVLSSPLLRAQETARPFASSRDIDIRIDERFREIPAPVPLENRQNWLREFMRGRWGEQDAALHDWREGLIGALHELDRPAVIFTHFLVINTLVGSLEQREETLVFWPANASVTVLTEDSSGLRTERLGEEMQSVVN